MCHAPLAAESHQPMHATYARTMYIILIRSPFPFPCICMSNIVFLPRKWGQRAPPQRWFPCTKLKGGCNASERRSMKLNDIILGIGQGYNSIYLCTNTLARQKMTLFMFILAVTENFSAHFVSSCISCSHWILRILYLGTLQAGSRHKSSLTNTSNVRYGLCTVAYLVG